MDLDLVFDVKMDLIQFWLLLITKLNTRIQKLKKNLNFVKEKRTPCGQRCDKKMLLK